jgi:predicted nucleotide-binding protein (sugar kinase/HSP70/actin superfamily)
MDRIRIGIPRALFYYYYFPLWKTFFQNLGLEVVLSPKTDKRMVDLGVQKTVDEVCFPVKIYFGHTILLSNQVDYLFVPRLISVESKKYICPKFMGLPDMIRSNLPHLPEIIDTTFDASKNPVGIWEAMEEVGQRFSREKALIARAWQEALLAQKTFEKAQKSAMNTSTLFDDDHSRVIHQDPPEATIALLGHGYNLYDTFAGMDIPGKLAGRNVKVITPEMLPENRIEEAVRILPKRPFWTLGQKVMGSVLYLMDDAKIDGFIHVASFGCGPDSLIGELAERYVRRESRRPFLALTIDEHTGEAGLETRLEAFLDMIKRRKVS